jgi:TetR/AcrR family transcriptional regulator
MDQREGAVSDGPADRGRVEDQAAGRAGARRGADADTPAGGRDDGRTGAADVGGGDDRTDAPARAGDDPQAADQERRPRRSPARGERKRDAERTRERILEAALVEFSEHGYAGARISAIAARAGSNQQLISYYFDGKAGLYQALTDRWRSIGGGISRPDAPLGEIVEGFLRSGVERRPWARLLAWEGLTGESGADDTTDDFLAAMVDDVRRRQRAGEIAEDLDPAVVLLVFFAATSAPTLLPQIVRRISGQDPDSPEFLDRYGDQLRRIVGRLTGPA